MSAMYRAATACRICGSAELEPVIDLGDQALTGIFPKSRDVDVPSGPLALVRCATGCGLVQIAHSYEPTAMYGGDYGYRSGLNRSMVEHLGAKV